MRQYGLIGFPLSHSFSQKYFAEKFLHENISDAVFLNFELPAIEEVEKVFSAHPHLKGLAVTIPYKKAILPYLHSADDVVTAVKACNCVKITPGGKEGFNTDVTGFEKSFTPKLQPHHQKALVLGTGGAAAAVEYVLNKLGIEYRLVSRKPLPGTINYTAINVDTLQAYPVIINCTPLGTYPDTATAPPLPYEHLRSTNYLFDLVYNPPLTTFLQHGKKLGCTIKNGSDMLAIQAEENWRIWNS